MIEFKVRTYLDDVKAAVEVCQQNLEFMIGNFKVNNKCRQGFSKQNNSHNRHNKQLKTELVTY